MMTATKAAPSALLTPLAERSRTERVAVRAAGAVLTAAAFLLFLPWDLRNRAETPGSITETTPVTSLGVAGFALVLLLVAAYLGARRDRLVWPPLVTAALPSALLLTSFMTHEERDASLWPLAWIFFTALMAGAALAAAAAARGVTTRR